MLATPHPLEACDPQFENPCLREHPFRSEMMLLNCLAGSKEVLPVFSSFLAASMPVLVLPQINFCFCLDNACGVSQLEHFPGIVNFIYNHTLPTNLLAVKGVLLIHSGIHSLAWSFECVCWCISIYNHSRAP